MIAKKVVSEEYTSEYSGVFGDFTLFVKTNPNVYTLNNQPVTVQQVQQVLNSVKEMDHIIRMVELGRSPRGSRNASPENIYEPVNNESYEVQGSQVTA